jgi:hypothetical protein
LSALGEGGVAGKPGRRASDEQEAPTRGRRNGNAGGQRRLEMRPVAWTLAVAALAAVGTGGSVTQAATSASAARIDEQAPAPERRAAGSERMTSRLAEVAREEDQRGRGAEKARALGLVVRGGRVRVVAEAQGTRGDVHRAISAAGGAVEASYADLVQALVPPASLQTLAGSSAITQLRAPHVPVEQVITGQEVGGSAANVFHDAFWKGTGVKVAIVDAGFSGLATRQGEGEIPVGTTNVDYCGGQFSSASPHGTAVAEIVHEVAPDAQLYLICVDSEVTLGQAKDYVKANGIPVVNMSLAFLNTGRGDGSGGPGTPNGIVADARVNGILWVNSAGNYAARHWSGYFDDTDGDDVHNFTPSDEGNTIFVSAGQTACAFLKWDQWPASNQDFDLYLVQSSTGNVVAASENYQTGSEPPTEELCYTNGLGSQNFFLAITRFSATWTPQFDLISSSHGLEYAVAAGSIVEPASSPNAMAVAALCWADSSLRPYSSQGPTIDGRTKPDIAGLDGVSSATYGIPSGCTGGFTGTSAASPHVAGLAALGKQQNPSLSVGQLQTWLEARALDVAQPGKDDATGSGRAFVHTFTDTPAWTGLQPSVELLFRKGTTGGCVALNPATGSRLYCPEQTVTRDQMAVFIVRSLGLPPLNPAVPTFADVPTNYWAFGHIEQLSTTGITTGCASAPLRFCPLDPVRRDQMAVFLVRAKGLTTLTPATATFADVPTTFWAYGWIERLYEQAITQGCASGPPRLYCPADSVTRRQMAAFLIRAFGPPLS